MLGVVSSEVCDGMHDCVWTRAVFIVWNLLEDTAQLQPWPRSLAYCQEVKGIRVGLNLCSKTVSWADVLFAYSCTATGDMVLLRNHTPKYTFDSKYKPSFWICKKISYKAFEVQNNLGKVKQVSINIYSYYTLHNVFTNLTDINSFGCTTKYINHPNLMSHLTTTMKAKTSHAS